MSQASQSTAANQKQLSQNKEAVLKLYQKQVKDDINSMLDNYAEIIKLAKVEEGSQARMLADAEQCHFEMAVRAANIVRAGESLMKLTSDLKQFLILNDFQSINESVAHSRAWFKSSEDEMDNKLLALRDDVAAELYQLEEDYYASLVK